MKFGTRILMSFFIVFGAGLYFLTHDALENIKFRYLEGVEESMVDQARVLAAVVSNELEKDPFPSEKLHNIFDYVNKEKFVARIYQLNKTGVDIRVYITDHKGILLFDSRERSLEGSDYSRWRDVYLTLRGKYGARSTRENPDDPDSSILYVAAPIVKNGEIAGVLTVVKPTTNINNFLQFAKYQVKKRSIFAGFFVVFLSFLIIVWITRPIKLLTTYANNVRAGKKAVLPKLGYSEIGDMGRSFDKMREALEGKEYVEEYVQTLTHEIKSPVAAIRGAAELLEEEMPDSQRARFLQNIRIESERIQHLVERMLTLSSLEKLNMIEKKEKVLLGEIVGSVLERMIPLLSKKKIEVEDRLDPEVEIEGDAFLLKQAVSNMIQNAVDFSPEKGRIILSSSVKDQQLIFCVKDNGKSIPDYALEKIFDRFFSLQRPDSGKKSTGLGLNFVREVALLHQGEIKVENNGNKGVRATLILPVGKG